MTRSKWLVPLSSVALGVLVFAAQWIGGDPGSGLESLAIMSALAAVLLLGGRNETIRGLRGDGRDERFRQIDVEATAIAGIALIIAIVAAFVIELARGHDGSPYGWLGATAGLTYLVALVAGKIRS